MAATDEALVELNAMMDEGIRLELDEQTAGTYRLVVHLEDASCADCLVPDATLQAIAVDALQRRGA